MYVLVLNAYDYEESYTDILCYCESIELMDKFLEENWRKIIDNYCQDADEDDYKYDNRIAHGLVIGIGCDDQYDYDLSVQHIDTFEDYLKKLGA